MRLYPSTCPRLRYYEFLTVLLFISLSANFVLALSNGEISSLEQIRSSWPFMNRIWTLPSSQGCEWQYITCSLGNDTDLHITELNIDFSSSFSSRKSYSLPPALNLLIHLKHLELRGLGLSGTIPDLLDLISLKTLYLEDNYDDEVSDVLSQLPNDSLTELHLISSMSGKIPPEISNFQKLKKFSLSSSPSEESNLNGPLPDTLYYHMPQLTHLDIHHTGIYGCFSQFGPQIEFLNFFDTYMKGNLSDACQYSQLTFLSIRQTEISGTIPQCLERLSKLEFLDLSDSPISGPFPPSFSLPSLKSLSVSNLPLGGSLPLALKDIPQLELLDFSYAGLHGSIPSFFEKFVNLTTLNLMGNELFGTISKLPPSIENIDLAGNVLSGDLSFIPVNIRPNTRIDLSSNDFYCTIPPQCFGIEKLWLALNSKIVGPLPNGSISAMNPLKDDHTNLLSYPLISSSETLHMPNMVDLNLFGISLGGFLPQLDAPLLKILNMSHCGLKGGLRPFSMLLESIDLSENDFEGFGLPSSLPPLLEILNLRNANLSGTIPSTLMDNVTEIVSIDLSHNRLEGKFPTFRSRFSLSLIFSHNLNLTGTLESLLESEAAVKRLEISHAGLMGLIPPFLLGSAFLEPQFFDLSHNALSGTINDIKSSMISLKLNNNQFEGRISFTNNLAQNLVFLDLSNNRFGPSGFEFNAPYLETLDIRNNRFEFDIGDGIQRFVRIQSVLADLNPIFGGILPNSVLPYLSSLSLRNTSINGTLNYQKLDILLKSKFSFLDVSGNPHLAPQSIQPPLITAPWTIQYDNGSDIPQNVECNAISSIYAFSSENRPFPLIFNFDAGLFQYQQCNCVQGSYGLPPNCYTCHSGLNCQNTEKLEIPTKSFVYLDTVAFYSNPYLGGNQAPSNDSSQENQEIHVIGLPSGRSLVDGAYNDQMLPLYIELCIGSEQQCQGTEISKDLIFKNFSYVSAALSKQCKAGSEGRLCSRCQCSRENPPCYFPRGSGCTQCPKNWKIPSRSLFWSVLAILVVLAYLLLTIIMLLVLRSRRTQVTKPWDQLSLVKRTFNRVLHFTELGVVPILVTFIQLLSELTNWDSHFLRWLSNTSKLINGDINGFGLWCLNPDFANPKWALISQELLPFAISLIFIASVGSAAFLYQLNRNNRLKEKFSCFRSNSTQKSHSLFHAPTSSTKSYLEAELKRTEESKSLLSDIGSDGSDLDFESPNGNEFDNDGFGKSLNLDDQLHAKTLAYPAAALASSMTFSVFQFFYFSSALAAADAFFTSAQSHTNERYLISMPWMKFSEIGGLWSVSFVFLILVVLGFPLYTLSLMVYFRKRIYEPRISIYFGSLVTRYRPGFIWWEFAKIAFKLSIAVSLRAVGKGSEEMSGIIALVIIVFGSTQSILRPWKRGLENSIDSIGYLLLLMNLLISSSLQSTFYEQNKLLGPSVVFNATFAVSVLALGFYFSVTEETSYHGRFRSKMDF